MATIFNEIAQAKTIRNLIQIIRERLSKGRTSYVVTGKGEEVSTRFRLVDAADLIVSNHQDGRINEDYPQELQPRDRTRFTSKLQVNNISRSLRPAQLTDSGLSSHGAPIVGPDNVVESGNGRTMGIIRAYAEGKADGYRAFLIENASSFGVSERDVKGMARPVLVRERLTDVDRVQFAKDSNLSDLQDMAASEKAFVDAESITPDMMQLFQPSESGDLLARSNDAFIRAFVMQIGATAAAGLLTEDGRPTRQLIDRLQNCIFAKAYKDERLVRLISEEPDPDMRNILTALNAAANGFAQMQLASGDAHRSTVNSIVDGVEDVNALDRKALGALKEAIDLVRTAKETGQHIRDVLSQLGMFENASDEAKSLALFIVDNNRSAKRMGRAFTLLAEKINEELTRQHHALGDMFGGGEVQLQDILRQVSRELEEDGKTGLGDSLFG